MVRSYGGVDFGSMPPYVRQDGPFSDRRGEGPESFPFNGFRCSSVI